MKPKTHTCNQCQSEMREFCGEFKMGVIIAYACENPACPNYALMQIPVEVMVQVNKSKEKVRK